MTNLDIQKSLHTLENGEGNMRNRSKGIASRMRNICVQGLVRRSTEIGLVRRSKNGMSGAQAMSKLNYSPLCNSKQLINDSLEVWREGCRRGRLLV